MATTILKWGNYGSHLDLDYDFVVSGRSWSLYAALVFRTDNYNMGSWRSTGSTFIHTVSVGGGLPYTAMHSSTTLIGRSFITSGTYPTNGAAPSVRFGWGFGVNSSWGGFPNNPGGEVTVTGPAIAAITPPSISAVSVSELSDTSAKLSFSVTNANNGSVSGHKIIISESNFGSAFKEISGTSGKITGLESNKTYYARAQASNQAGTGYSAVKAFTTGFTNPGAPSNLKIECSNDEPIINAQYTLKWTAGSAGSKPISGYRLRIYKNDAEYLMVDTESTDTKYVFDMSKSDFQVGDEFKFGLYSYSKDWNNGKHFNGGGASTSQVFSGKILIVSDKYIYVSLNGDAFDKRKMYISINGDSFKEVKKEKFKIIQ